MNHRKIVQEYLTIESDKELASSLFLGKKRMVVLLLQLAECISVPFINLAITADIWFLLYFCNFN